MSPAAASRKWAGPLAYTAMSALVVWHTLAMLVGPGPNSASALAARRPFEPYLTLLRIDDRWGFFAPNVDRGSQFRYVVEDTGGQRHTFIPAEKLSRLHPTSIWFRDLYQSVIEAPDTLGDAVAASFCRQHAALQPKAITLQQVVLGTFLPADRLRGKDPLDADFVDVKDLKTIRCPDR
jgi:hypothetical protein